jgi:hypothetical protein
MRYLCKSWSIGNGWLFSNLRLCKSMDMAWCMAMWLMLMHVCLIVDLGILSLSYRRVMDGMYIVTHTLAVITIRGAIDHPFSRRISISGWYLIVLYIIFYGEKRPIQNVNSMNWRVRAGLGPVGGVL